MSSPSPSFVDPLDAWLDGPFGQCLLRSERIAVETALEDVFGTQFLQVGHWGPAATFLSLPRLPRRGLVADPGYRGHCVSHASSLAIQSQAADAILLPHTLEFEPDPHEVLREIARVLAPEGHILILGFEPTGLWASRHRLTRGGFPPGLVRTLSRGRLRDWLRLLGFEVLAVQRFLTTPPIEQLAAGTASSPPVGGLEARFGNVYLMKARKRVYTLTPIRPRRRRARSIVGTAVETP
jgi:SAM-dependent methyltransferase